MTIHDKAAISIVNAYQQYISPHKGFTCAYRTAYSAPSCSEYFKQIISSNGLWSALSELLHRGKECSMAAKMLAEIKKDKDGKQENAKSSNKHEESMTDEEGCLFTAADAGADCACCFWPFI
jgi:putative component of membrane protein insertase Oxa1/YidC/SpoIIIJ protein YidD